MPLPRPPRALDLDVVGELAARGLRAWLLGGFAMVGLVAAAQVPFVGAPGVGRQTAAVPFLVAQAVIVAVVLGLGRRLGDRGYVLAHVALALSAGPLLIMSTARGSARSPELVLLAPLVMGAVFSRTRVQTSVIAISAIVGAGAVSAHRVVEPADAVAQVVGQAITFAVIAVVIRWLRESAHGAVVSARRGELTDPLTGLVNRRGLTRGGVTAFAHARAVGSPVAVLVLDLDHFKEVNDALGHAAGDAVLASVGSALRAAVRSGDVAARLGGEEFAVVCVAAGEVERIGERLRTEIDAAIAPQTVSVGGVELQPSGDSEEDLWRAVAVADECLYRAKRAGRDTVVVTRLG